ncbi:tetratricopeptide repeat protein [Desulfuromonas thiophila]|uniref:Lipopolysaccharide biosynthesis regulator YciM, contains six TPR domains and a predicted metal-binding C-terminal domain n=1 Tax=Desulfuromonas thiophila TaxID=57664 RepID=A0A1G6XQJ6_9BACT|nr:tetratricopeptide repeat protein [Desulfuromonas thiophila]SDD80282.1 Lipopolysaccharide biosynthesis regulator YciM, contains six TPR domains and a predicted metal-binding C-terminal domain [Desulfuromonas thiophila]
MTLMSFLLIVIVFLAFFVFFSGINPQEMTIFFLPEQSVTYPVTVIVIGCILVGLFIGYGLHLYGALSCLLRGWLRGRNDKRSKEVDEIYREGVGRLLSGDIKKAHSLLQKAIDKDPGKTESYIAMASVVSQEGDLDGAVVLLRKAKSIDARSLEVLFKLAATYEKQGQDDAACKEYEDILEQEKDNRKAIRSLRNLHMKHNRWQQALELQKQLLKAGLSGNRIQEEKQTQLSIRYEIARMDLEAGQFDPAVAALKQLIKENADFVAARVTLGDAFQSRGNVKDAADVWQDGYRRLGRSVFLSRLENLYIQQEDPQSLLAFYSQALTARSTDLVLRFFYGKLCLRLEMVDEALEQIYLVENSAPDFPQIHILLAEAHRRRDRTDEAIEEYQKALGVDNQLNLGYVCDSCGRASREWMSRCPQCGTWGSYSIAFRKLIRDREVVPPAAAPHGA